MWNRTENKIEIYMIRHGKTVSNIEHRYIGRTDEALSEQGKQELSEIYKNRKMPAMDKVYSSPMKRCTETAELLGFKELSVIDEFREIDFGRFEGKNYSELQADEDYKRWIDSYGTMPFPDGESRDAFIERSICGFLKVYKEAVQLSEEKKETVRIAMVVHGGTIMAVLSKICGKEYFDFQAANGDGYIIRFPEKTTEKLLEGLC